MIFWFLSAAALLLLVLGLRRLLRDRVSPVLQYALWLLPLLRLLIPGGVLFSSPLSLENLTERTVLSRDLEELRGVERLEHFSDGLLVGYADGDYAGDFPTVIREYAVPEQAARMYHTLEAREVLLPLWLAGAGAVGLTFFISNLSFARRLRRSRKALEAAGSLLPVYVCAGIRTPCLFGLFRPAIYITPEVAESGTKLRHVLAHETTHYRHGDNLWAALRALALALHWFNPLAWYAAALSRRDAETACDAGAVKRLGEAQRGDYGKTLIGLTVAKRSGFDLLCCATTMSGGGKVLKERIRVLARNPKTKLAGIVAVILAAGVAAVCLFFGAARETAPKDLAPAEEFIPAEVTVTSPLSSTAVLRGETDPAEVARLWELYRSMDVAQEETAPDPAALRESWMLDIAFRGPANGPTESIQLWGPYLVEYVDGALRYYEVTNGDAVYEEFHAVFERLLHRQGGPDLPQVTDAPSLVTEAVGGPVVVSPSPAPSDVDPGFPRTPADSGAPLAEAEMEDIGAPLVTPAPTMVLPAPTPAAVQPTPPPTAVEDADRALTAARGSIHGLSQGIGPEEGIDVESVRVQLTSYRLDETETAAGRQRFGEDRVYAVRFNFHISYEPTESHPDYDRSVVIYYGPGEGEEFVEYGRNVEP